MGVICLTINIGNGQAQVEPAVVRSKQISEAAAAWSKATGKVLAAPAKLGLVGNGSLREVYTQLDTWPVIKLVVMPVPPLDYSVSINGQTMNVTERSEYAVPPGTDVVMNVTRGSYPPCAWVGHVVKNEQVICRLP
jgi:hypothetical protein